MTTIRYNDRDPGPTGPVRDLQRALMALGHELPRYGDDGHLGAETWDALGLGPPPGPGEHYVGEALYRQTLAALPCASSPRRIPIETKRGWPSRGARAWLATRADGARLHAGVDLGVSHDPILAPESCRVERVITASYGGRKPRQSRPAGWAGYGPMAVLVRALPGPGPTPVDRWHLLAHIDRVVVAEGDVLALGQPIGQVAPIGAHLHWEVRMSATPTGGAAVVETVLDPGSWLYGVDRQWVHGEDPCPPRPERSARTPRPCRP